MGLIEAGVGELVARTLVASVREAARYAGGGGRAEARELLTAAVRGALSEGQTTVIDFLVKDGDDALPLAALARSVIALHDLSREDAKKIVDALSQAGRGVDGALAILEAAAR